MNSGRARPAVICLALVALTWAVFGQAVRFDFVNYDDPEWVRNGHITPGLTMDGIRWAFTRMHAGPLASVSHMADYEIFGPRAAGHHFTNVLLHSLAGVLLFLALRALTGSVWRSAFVAAVFLIHPLRAESVAWITERKDVLSGVFFVLTLAAYSRYARGHNAVWYLLALSAFALGLLSKSMLVTVPFVLLLLDFWPLNAETRSGGLRTAESSTKALRRAPLLQDHARLPKMTRLVVEKLPFFLLSLAGGLATWWAHTAAVVSIDPVPFSARLAHAAIAPLIYIWQLLYPAGLNVFYGFTDGVPAIAAVAALALLVAISVAVVLVRKQGPYLVTGWFWYLVMILPVTGIWQIAGQAHADRYTYLPQIGLLICIAWLAADLLRARPAFRPVASAAALVVIGLLAVAGHRAVAFWKDSETLWRRAVAVNARNDFAHASLADLLLRQGRVTEAITEAEAALAANHDNSDAHNHLALAISRRGRLSEAIEHWEKSLDIHPQNLNARVNLAWVLATAPNDSIRNGARAVQLVEPVALGSGGSNPAVLRVLAAAYAEAGRFDDALNASKQGLEAATRQGDADLAAFFRFSLERYQNGHPLRDDALKDTSNIPPTLLRQP